MLESGVDIYLDDSIGLILTLFASPRQRRTLPHCINSVMFVRSFFCHLFFSIIPLITEPNSPRWRCQSRARQEERRSLEASSTFGFGQKNHSKQIPTVRDGHSRQKPEAAPVSHRWDSWMLASGTQDDGKRSRSRCVCRDVQAVLATPTNLIVLHRAEHTVPAPTKLLLL